MGLSYCPGCQTRILVAEHSGDFVHKCNSKKAVIDNEDVLVIGNWTDLGHEVGSDFNVERKQGPLPGVENRFFGTMAWLQDADLGDLTVRGKTKSLHRTRPRLQYIEYPNGR